VEPTNQLPNLGIEQLAHAETKINLFLINGQFRLLTPFFAMRRVCAGNPAASTSGRS
jgi:hypothetical protein